MLKMEGQEEQGSNGERIVTPQKLRNAASQAELRGDWLEASLLLGASDRLIMLEAQNQAYRHALANGVSIKVITTKRRLFKRD
jgi:hypothetical protein